MSKIYEAILDWAEKNNLSAQAACTELEVPYSVFYRWGQGSVPRPDTVRKVAEKIGVPVSDLSEQRLKRLTARPHTAASENAKTLEGQGKSASGIIAFFPASVAKQVEGFLNLCGGYVVGTIGASGGDEFTKG